MDLTPDQLAQPLATVTTSIIATDAGSETTDPAAAYRITNRANSTTPMAAA